VENLSPENEEEIISKSQQLDIIYTQYRYLYHVLLDAPHLQNFKQERSGTSNVFDRLVGTIAQNQLGNNFQYPGYTYSGQPLGATT